MNDATIFAGGPIHTMSEAGMVESVRSEGGRINFAGLLTDARSLGSAAEVNLDGRCLLPGFVDAHTR